MDRRISVYALLSLIMFACAWFAGRQNHNIDTGEIISQKIENHLVQCTNKFTEFQTAFTNQGLTNIKQELTHSKNFIDKRFDISVYLRDSLVLWTNHLFAHEAASKNPGLFFHHAYVFYRNVWTSGDTLVFVQHIPIHSTIAENSSSPITSLRKYPQDAINLSSHQGKYVIHSQEGETIAFLDYNSVYSPSSWTGWMFIFYFLAYFFVALFSAKLIDRISIISGKPQMGPILLFVIILIIRYVWHKQGMSEYFDEMLSIISNVNKPNSSGSLGDILINITLLFWLLLYTYRSLQNFQFGHLPRSGKLFLAVLNYYGTLVALVMITRVFRSIVLFAPVNFDFEQVFNTPLSSIMALLGMLALLFLFFVVSHRMAFVISKLYLNLPEKLLSIICAFALIYPFFQNLDTGFSIILLYLVALAYLMLFDIYTEIKRPTIFWLLIWLIIFSGFSSVLLYKYHLDKDNLYRQEIGIKLLEKNDFALQAVLDKFETHLADDSEIINQQFSSTTGLEQIATQYLLRNPYITRYYDVQVELLESNQEVNNLGLNHIGRHSYIYILKPDNYPNIIKISIDRKKAELLPHYPAIFHHINFKNIPDLNLYSYAIYHRDSLVESRYAYYPDHKFDHIKVELGIPEIFNIINRSELVYSIDGVHTVFVGRIHSGYMNAISFFSFLFSLLVGMVLLIAVINAWMPFLPAQMPLSLSAKLSLRNKIQFAVITLIVLSFFCIGWITIYYFNNINGKQELKKLETKALQVQADLLHQLKIYDYDIDKIKENIPDYAKDYFVQMAVFAGDGHLLNSSFDEIFYKGYISNRAHATVYQRISKDLNGHLEIQKSETIATQEFNSAYIPLILQNKLYGIIQLITPENQGERLSGVRGFMSTLLNVYVFLLIIAITLALAVSNSITKPIRDLGEKMKSIKLGKKNEALQWKQNDELGVLIRQYNSMVESLDKSAELLAQNERELAWREMAKQVAHEIKNPLTPMKLSIQHLETKIASLDPDEIPPFVKRISATLIEQIDNLTRIATEFSSFSKLPEPNNEKIVLNDVVSSVHDLFRKREDILFNLYVPIDEIYIYADRSHILRILNNLIKNAIQAIPDNHKGKLDIKLYTRKRYAIIQVSDNGTGIPKDMQDKVFYPNFTTKSSGTGLGLAICKDIVESYGGRIYFHTREGSGTDFYVEMPLYGEE